MNLDRIRALVGRLSAAEIHLYVDGAELKYRARKGAILERDRRCVMENKSAIIDYLRRMQQLEVERSAALPPIEVLERDSCGTELSYGQQRIWFIDYMNKGNAQSNMPSSFLLDGVFEIGVFEMALDSLLARHAVLRTYFVECSGIPKQLVTDQYVLPLQLHDLSRLSEEEKACEAIRRMRAEARAPFDLSRDLMLRVQVLKLSERRHLVLYTMHHISSDGWSIGIFRNELSVLYAAYLSGKGNPLQPLEIQYTDYARWQRTWLDGHVLEKQLWYWRDQLQGLPLKHDLPLDKPRPAEQSFRGSTERFALPGPWADKLQAVSRDQGATLFMTLLSAFAVLLGRYSSQEDIVVGTSVSNRPLRETEELIGFFVNTLVMRIDLRGDPSFALLLKRTRDMAMQAYAHQDIPFEYLVEKLNPVRNLSHSPLIQVMFILQNAPFDSFDLPDLKVGPAIAWQGSEHHEISAGTSRYDFTLSVQELPTGLAGEVEYNTDLFESGTVRRMLDHFAQLLKAIVSTPNERLSRLEMMSDTERKQLVYDWNAPVRA